MNYQQAILKRNVELVLMFPFVLLGKIAGRLFPLKTPTEYFFFFPSADIGGSIKVNADVTQCFRDKHPLIIFSKKPKNNGFIDMFKIPGVRLLDLHKKIDHKLYHFINFFYRGVLATWINRAENAVVFGGECMYFYKIIPHLNKKKVRVIELSHLDTWLNFELQFIKYIDWRLVSSIKLKQDMEDLYRKYQVERKYYGRIYFIENKIDIPVYDPIKNERLEVVFIGRGAPQKRVHLSAAIAQKMHALGLPVHFAFVGDVERVINPSDYPFCTFYGNIKDNHLMQEIYMRSDVLIITSAYEGLPLVVMQMMAYGKVILSTAINAIPDYVKHLENGLLIKSTAEEEIVQEGVSLLQLLIEKPDLLETMGNRSREIAREKFSGEVFCREYFGFLNGLKKYPELS